MATAHVDHVAIRVRDLQWFLDFFQNTLGMEVTLTDPAGMDPAQGLEGINQIWVGGIQLQRADAFEAEGPDKAQMSHFGIVLKDVEGTLEKVYAIDGIKQAEGKPRNWFVLPDGPMIELNELED